MEIDKRFIIFRPDFGQEIKTEKSEQKSLPLSETRWKGEMEDLFSLYEEKNVRFSKVEDSMPKSPLKSERRPSKDPMDEIIEKTSDQLKYGRPASIAESKAVLENRSGEILSKGRFLKADQFDGIHRLQGEGPAIEGAPNYRKVEGEGIHGVGQPTVSGMKKLLDGLEPGKKVLWTNMREEPVLYIDGTPFNLRDMSEKFKNLENPGIDAKELEKTEEALKKEVLAEAEKNGGYILLHDEVKYFDSVQNRERYEVVPRKVKVSEESVKTVKETFEDLKNSGYNVEYARIPITDEKRPEAKDFDALVRHLKNQDPDTQLIFNCHMGQGRTTTAMVAASLIRSSGHPENEEKSILRNEAIRDDIKENGRYNRGEYKIILSAVKALEQGPKSKETVDEAIDRYSALTNLRESIADNKTKAQGSSDPVKKEQYEQKGKDYLERYFYLINFNSYLKEQQPSFGVSFEEWMEKKPEQLKMLENFQLAMGISRDGGNAGPMVA